MKRFLRFLLFLLLLALAVASVQVWTDRRHGTTAGWRRSVLELLNGDGARRRPEKYTVAEGPRVDLKDVNVLAALSQQRIGLARAVVPSVVSITASRTVQVPADHSDPFYFFHPGVHKGGATTRRQLPQLGSGVIVSKEGHIVTNNHVIEGMETIEVELNDGRHRPARLIGTDPDSDIAVLKVDAGDLQPLPFGDSDGVQVGETVMAVGNPYGLEESVTQGIISAKGRHGSENTSDLFQTDAAINPGNSGGPLINVRGELIGINEAIYSETGGWQGVGFAVPAATVRRTMDGILKLGRVVHGYLGIQQRPLDPDTVNEKNLGDARGVVVDSIVPGSPADKAALQPGDVIRTFNHKAVNDFEDLRRGVAGVDVDATVPVEVVRGDKKLLVNARIAERPPPEAQLSQAPHYPHGQRFFPGNGSHVAPASGGLLGGLQTRELTPADRRTLDLPENTKGMLVTAVEGDSPTAEKVQLGDVIEAVNQQPVATLEDFARRAGQIAGDKPVVLSIIRDRSRMMVVINPG